MEETVKEKNMEVELRIAVEFLLSFVVKKFKIENTEGFIQSLMSLLIKKFEGHWYPEHPNKGSAYRCISLCDQLDGVLIRAAKDSGLEVALFEESLPKRLDLWIDPHEVSYRIGQYGSVTQIYKKNDPSVNLASEYAMAVLNKNAVHYTESKDLMPSSKEVRLQEGTKGDSNTSNKIKYSQHVKGRDSNRLSPTAKSFVSRRSPPILPSIQQNVSSSVVYPSKPIGNVDYMRKVFWHPVPVHPTRIQAHNYMVAQEIARFEAHMKAQRIALHTHYYKSPFQYVRQLPGQYQIGPSRNVHSNSSNLRVQVVA